MAPKKSTPTSAWEDDWESIADVLRAPLPNCAHPTNPAQKQDETDTREDAILPAKLSKAERRAKHAEFNRQIWESA
jgi:hypothetical protein